MLTYRVIANMDFDTFEMEINKLHDELNDIQLNTYPETADILCQLAKLDTVRGVVTAYYSVASSQSTVADGIMSMAKKVMGPKELKNEAERKNFNMEFCKEFKLTPSDLLKLYYVKDTPATIVNLFDVVTEMNGKYSLVSQLEALMNNKLQALTMQASLIKSESNAIRGGLGGR